jgi:hypothetical protein
MKKGGAVKADLDEGRLHSGENGGDGSFVDVTDDAPLGRALDKQLDKLRVFQNCDSCLGRIDVYDNLTKQKRSLLGAAL